MPPLVFWGPRRGQQASEVQREDKSEAERPCSCLLHLPPCPSSGRCPHVLSGTCLKAVLLSVQIGWMGGNGTSLISSLVLAKRGSQHSPERSLLHSLPPSLIPLSNICWEPAMSGRSHVCWAAGASKQTGGPALTQLLPSGGRQAMIKISNL